MGAVERLFVGGPLDGQRRTVDETMRYFIVELKGADVAPAWMAPGACRTVCYRLEWFIDAGHQPFGVFVLEGMGQWAAAVRVGELASPVPALPPPPGLQDVTLGPEAAEAIRVLLDGPTPGAAGREMPTLPDTPSFAPRGDADA